ncbi:MAG: hypothetical protein AB1698_01495 [Pseudomonadota bacterium]
MAAIHSNAEPLLKLRTTSDEFEELHRVHDKTRATSKTLTVSREALGHLLMDHSALVDEVRHRGRVEVPTE